MANLACCRFKGAHVACALSSRASVVLSIAVRFMSEEKAAHKRTRQAFLCELHTKRTTGFQREAEILLKCGRVLAGDDAGDTDGDHFRGADSLAITASRWAAHICRELRRNRFAAHCGAMRRNVIPVGIKHYNTNCVSSSHNLSSAFNHVF